MAAVKVNELHIDDLPWLVEYDETKCVQCGKCTAVCSFGAIEPKVEKRKKESSIAQKPTFSKDIYPNEREMILVNDDLTVTRWQQ